MPVNQVFNFLPIPTDIHFGHGALQTLPNHLRNLNARRVFIVTDPGLAQAGVLEQVTALLEKEAFEVMSFTEVTPDSGTTLIQNAATQVRSFAADAVIGLGGGSSLDSAKAAALLATTDSLLESFYGLGKAEHEPLPVVAIPTTAGTGSEVSLWSVFTNDSNKTKVAIGGIKVYPRLALGDPELTLSLPPGLTAATGMDALTHAVECYTNLACQPISEVLAYRAIELIGHALRQAVHQPGNLQARYDMLLGSMLAGMAMNPTRLGLSHALAMPLGSWDLKIPHGLANAITLPHVMDFNHVANPPRFAAVTRALGERTSGMTDLQAAKRAGDMVRELNRDIGITTTLKDHGLTQAHIDPVVDEAMKSGNVAVNPRRTNRADLKQVLEAAW